MKNTEMEDIGVLCLESAVQLAAAEVVRFMLFSGSLGIDKNELREQLVKPSTEKIRSYVGIYLRFGAGKFFNYTGVFYDCLDMLPFFYGKKAIPSILKLLSVLETVQEPKGDPLVVREYADHISRLSLLHKIVYWRMREHGDVTEGIFDRAVEFEVNEAFKAELSFETPIKRLKFLAWFSVLEENFGTELVTAMLNGEYSHWTDPEFLLLAKKPEDNDPEQERREEAIVLARSYLLAFRKSVSDCTAETTQDDGS